MHSVIIMPLYVNGKTQAAPLLFPRAVYVTQSSDLLSFFTGELVNFVNVELSENLDVSGIVVETSKPEFCAVVVLLITKFVDKTPGSVVVYSELLGASVFWELETVLVFEDILA